MEAPVCREHREDPLRAQGPHQLVLQVGGAHPEPETPQVAGIDRLAPAGRGQAPDHQVRLARIEHPGHDHAGIELRQMPAQVGDAPHRHDLDTLRLEVAATPPGQGLDGRPVTGAFDQDHGAGSLT